MGEDKTFVVEKIIPGALECKVKFDLGVIDNPKFPKVHVKGEFPRIKPKHKRNLITEKEIEETKKYLQAWYNQFFDSNKYIPDVDNVIDASINLVGYTDPNHEFGGMQMNLLCKVAFIVYIFDEVLETAIANNASFLSLKNGIAQLSRIFESEEKEFIEVEEFPVFRCLFNSFVHLRNSFLTYDPTLRTQLWSCASTWRRYFDAARWCAVAKFDGAYSEEMFRQWRRIIGFGFGVLEHIWLLSGGPLPEDIYKSASFEKIIDYVDSMTVCVNDVVGFKNELGANVNDNWLLFKINEKKIPVERAVEEVCEFIASEVSDYILLRRTIQEEFDYHPGLVKYLDILDTYLDGQNRYYNSCARYGIKGLLTIVD